MYLKVVVKAELDLQAGVVSSLHLNDVSDEVRTEHQRKRLHGVRFLGLTSCKHTSQSEIHVTH